MTSAPMPLTVQSSQVISLANNDFRAVATGDFDDDGESDFVAANYSTAEVYVFLGNGDGSFQTPTALSVGYGAVALAVADLGNGTLDIVVANSSDGTVTILSNDGNGSFTVSQTLSVGNDPRALAVGDFLGNGRVDLAVANQGDDTVSLFANDGSGSFTLDSTVNVGTEPAALAAADLDDDGFDDLVVANSGAGTISVLLNTGSGGFATPVSYTVGTSPKALVVADFDDDGNLDVAVANSGSDSVSVLFGNGDGSLEDAVTYAVGTTPVSLVVLVGNEADVAHLMVANQGSNNLTVLANNGFGAFTASQTIPLGHSPDAVAVADFDNDGLPDYVADGELEVGGVQDTGWLSDNIQRQKLPDGKIALYYKYERSYFHQIVTVGIGTWKQATEVPGFIGVLDPQTGIVTRGNFTVAFPIVRGETKSIWTTSDWAKWFADNGTRKGETKSSLINLQAAEGISPTRAERGRVGEKYLKPLAYDAMTAPLAAPGVRAISGVRVTGGVAKIPKAGVAPNTIVDFSRELTRDRGNATRSLRNALSTNSKIERPHHIIPWEARELPVVQAAARGGFNINGANNGINLILKVHPQGARHPRLNDAVMRQLDALGSRNLTDAQAAAEVQAIVDRLRPGLQRLNKSGTPLR